MRIDDFDAAVLGRVGEVPVLIATNLATTQASVPIATALASPGA